jgi:hypothetical protein
MRTYERAYEAYEQIEASVRGIRADRWDAHQSKYGECGKHERAHAPINQSKYGEWRIDHTNPPPLLTVSTK